MTTIEQASLLGLSSPATLKRWRRVEAVVLTRNALERISYVLGIFRAINILIPRAMQADSWIRRANAAPLFGGRSALDRMLGGNVGDLYAVRHYLDAQLAS
ncbi:antitoxin Xre/MbcA/ParS toxin-binding domain-containing protein [Sphingomonas sp. LY54]|uniref:antitoxin Xre/MbcA/ParS toxin-binding domain-containing protein n=1 Tax=Sphingomonas sp. LY54 TaxID=3095343 RepID=UPI002D79FD64|nr:antitoxin Xre/MbcA/ParS toxin-binding domain-containing protein [Sphingomonas sp. LY54]WRP30018.1 antitoxin Xre/MbcA/ParS toxin-binding domain-containing protein [Sphingomonas sp. LY54]